MRVACRAGRPAAPLGAARPGVEGQAHDPVGAQEVAGPPRLGGVDRLGAADLGGVDLLPRHPLHEDGEEGRLLHRAAGGQQAVVGEQQRVLAAQAFGDQLALAVGGRQPGPVGQEGGVVEQRRRIHVGDDQRLLGRGQGRGRGRMGVDDRRARRRAPGRPRGESGSPGSARGCRASPRPRAPRAHRRSAATSLPRPRRRRGRAAGSRRCPAAGRARSAGRRARTRGLRRRGSRPQRVSARRGSLAGIGDGRGRARGASAAGRDLLQLVVELGVRLGAVDALGVGRLDPVLGQRRGQRCARRRRSAGLASVICTLAAFIVSRPTLSAASQALPASRASASPETDSDRVLVLLRQLVPLVLVHEEAERRRVEAAGEEGRVLDHLVEVEGLDRLRAGRRCRRRRPTTAARTTRAPA